VLLRQLTGDATAVDDLVRVNQSIVDGIPEHHPERASYRDNLRTFLVGIAGDPAPGLLARVVPLAREATVDPPDPSLFVELLGACLGELSRSTGDPDVLAELVAVDRQRIAHAPPDAPDMGPLLSDLGADLRDLALASDRSVLLDEAVDVGRRSVDACPPDQARDS
jgi:hypothetical protein